MTQNEIYKAISEIDPENNGYIQYDLFADKIKEREVERQLGDNTEELLDAFVAMGGEPNGEGCVDAKKLI